MSTSHYRVESNNPIVGPLVPTCSSRWLLLRDRQLAVAIAAKSRTRPRGKEIRVVHVASGEVVFRKTGVQLATDLH